MNKWTASALRSRLPYALQIKVELDILKQKEVLCYSCANIINTIKTNKAREAGQRLSEQALVYGSINALETLFDRNPAHLFFKENSLDAGSRLGNLDLHWQSQIHARYFLQRHLDLCSREVNSSQVNSFQTRIITGHAVGRQDTSKLREMVKEEITSKWFHMLSDLSPDSWGAFRLTFESCVSERPKVAIQEELEWSSIDALYMSMNGQKREQENGVLKVPIRDQESVESLKRVLENLRGMKKSRELQRVFGDGGDDIDVKEGLKEIGLEGLEGLDQKKGKVKRLIRKEESNGGAGPGKSSISHATNIDRRMNGLET